MNHSKQAFELIAKLKAKDLYHKYQDELNAMQRDLNAAKIKDKTKYQNRIDIFSNLLQNALIHAIDYTKQQEMIDDLQSRLIIQANIIESLEQDLREERYMNEMLNK